jgi:hypothetical protein
MPSETFWYNWPETLNIDSISLISIYLLKNSYYVKIRKLKILTRIGNVFYEQLFILSWQATGITRSRFYHWLAVRFLISSQTSQAHMWLGYICVFSLPWQNIYCQKMLKYCIQNWEIRLLTTTTKCNWLFWVDLGWFNPLEIRILNKEKK